MKKKNLILTKMFLVAMLFLAIGCNNDDPNNPSNQVPDPEGTKTKFLRVPYWQTIQGRNFHIFSYILWIDGNEDTYTTIGTDLYNFRCSDNTTIADAGYVYGLGNITKIPISGFSKSSAINYHHGYVVRIEINKKYTYGRLFVVDDTTDGTKVKYQYPFEP